MVDHVSTYPSLVGGGTGGRPESKMEISIFAGVIVQRLHCIVDQYLHQNRDNISLPKPFDNVHKKRETFYWMLSDNLANCQAQAKP